MAENPQYEVVEIKEKKRTSDGEVYDEGPRYAIITEVMKDNEKAKDITLSQCPAYGTCATEVPVNYYDTVNF